jgi:predicted ribosomally synthesized peptide with SipW-like signal peptide
MKHPGRKRLYLAASGVTAVGAAAALIAGTTFGLFSSQAPAGSQTFTAGTVTVSSDQVVSCTLTPGDVKPGDSGTCTFNYAYSGNPAWLAVDIAGASTASTTTPPTPYAGTAAPTAVGLLQGSNPLVLSVNTGSALSYTPDSSGAASIKDVLLSSASTPTAGGATGPMTLHWALPAAAGNEYQGGSATLTLTIHAVQAKNNPMVGAVSGTTGTLAPCTQYGVCPAGTKTDGAFAWS